MYEVNWRLEHMNGKTIYSEYKIYINGNIGRTLNIVVRHLYLFYISLVV